MAIVKTIKKGESLSFGFVFPDTYDITRLQNVKVYIGSSVYTHSMDGQKIRVVLRSNDTKLLTGTNVINLLVDDSVFGIRKVDYGSLQILPTQAIFSDESFNSGYDFLIPLIVTENTISVENVLYSVIKGEKGDAGTIEVGTVTTGDAGTDVIVENVGTTSEAVLNFTIPRGDAGYTPYIGENGNWFINGVDTGVQAEGDATQQWVTDNFVAKETGKSLIDDTEITRLAGVTNQTLAGLGGESVSNKKTTLADNSDTFYPSQKAVKTAVDLKETAANKQNSLAPDGTGVKFPTVDAVNAMIVGELGGSETKVVNQKKISEELNSKVSTLQQTLTEKKQYQARKNINSIYLKVERSTNILNRATSQVKTYVNTEGGLSVADDDSYESTDFIPWRDATKIRTGINGVLAKFFTTAQYDENKTYLPGTYTAPVAGTNILNRYTGSEYFRITYQPVILNQINFGDNLLSYAANGSKVSKEELDTPIVFKPDTEDESLSNIFAKKFDTTSKDEALILQKNGSSDFDIINKITPPGGVWAAAASYNNKWYQVNYIGKTKKIINRISIPIVRNLYANSVFTDGITVRLFKSGIELLTKVIPFSVVSTYNSLTAASPLASFFYDIDVFPFELGVDEVLWVGVECNAATDKISMVYNMNTASDANEYSRNYTTYGDTAGTVINAISQPALPASAAFYRVIKFSFVDYISKSIWHKTDETVVAPNKIYTVCNDLKQTDSGFDSRNYSSILYVDHFLKLASKKNVVFDSTKSDKLPIFSPIAVDNSSYNGGVNVKTDTITDKLTGDVNDIALSFNRISTKASVGAAKFPKILVIGDSVTDGFLADKPTGSTTNNPTTFWSYVKKFFHLDFLDATTGHSCLLLGKQSSRQFVVNGTTLKSYAEGRGGWTTRNYLYDANYGSYTNYFYDGTKPTVKFSLSKYLADYKTLADDGVTRLQVGSTAGALVTDVNAHDVCTPTHVVIQTGFNDTEANWAVDVQLMIDSIKAEFPDMIIIVSTIDAAGTYFPEKYPKFDASSYNLLGDTLHSKMWNLLTSAKALEDAENKIFYCPNYFIQPTAYAVAYRNVDFPESLANAEFSFKTEHGAGNNYHPNTYAHAAWGYQLYALIKYTLTL